MSGKIYLLNSAVYRFIAYIYANNLFSAFICTLCNRQSGKFSYLIRSYNISVLILYNYICVFIVNRKMYRRIIYIRKSQQTGVFRYYVYVIVYICSFIFSVAVVINKNYVSCIGNKAVKRKFHRQSVIVPSTGI